MASADHEFGNISTDLKLSLIEDYLSAFTNALKNRYPQLWYIDAFAGTGERTVRFEAAESNLLDEEAPERIERYRGSARIAIDTNPPFQRLVFMDKKPQHCQALRELKQNYPNRHIEVIEGEANDAINKLVKSTDWRSTRAVMFLDPYGMSVNWTTLQTIRESEAIDVWYLYSLSGLFRQAARNRSAMDKDKRDAIARTLGTTEWEKEWYEETPVNDLFGNADKEAKRIADVNKMEAFVLRRLRQLFPAVLEPFRLNDARGIPQFALFFAISNPDPKAIGLATKIAGHILNSGKASQVRPR